jgi:serine/threonine-protein kinase RsbW
MVSDVPPPTVPPRPLPDAGSKNGRQWSVHTLGEIGPFIDAFVADLTAAGFNDKDVFGTRLAVVEAVVNGLRHGNADDPGKQVLIQYSVTADEVRLTIEDEGRGFNPDSVPNPLAAENLERPSGRGVFLMRCCMTWVQFNQTGNSVTMCKRKE